MILHSKPTIGKDEIKAIKEVLLSCQLSQGKKTREFEEKFSEYIGTKYAIATSCGTSALHLALLSLGIEKQDEVIIPNYTCCAVLNAVLYVGAKPVLCDISEEDYNIDFQEVKKKITKRTKAIIVVHLFGQPANIDKFLSLSIPIIEDAAHAPGAEYKGKKVGSFGKVNVFSFYATKFITTGEGGAITTQDKKIYDKIMDLREYDKKASYRLRYNYKITDIASSIGIVQLSKIDTFIKKRRYIASIYDRNFNSLPVIIPKIFPNSKSVYYRYCIRVKNRDRVKKEMIQSGIEVKKPIFKPLNKYLNLPGFKNSEKIDKEILSLPIYPSLKKNEIEKVIQTIKVKL